MNARYYGIMRRLADGYVQLVAVAFSVEGARKLYEAHAKANPQAIFFVKEPS